MTAFKYGMIKEEKIYLNRPEDRNGTVRIYNESIAEDIFNNIVN